MFECIASWYTSATYSGDWGLFSTQTINVFVRRVAADRLLSAFPNQTVSQSVLCSRYNCSVWSDVFDVVSL